MILTMKLMKESTQKVGVQYFILRFSKNNLSVESQVAGAIVPLNCLLHYAMTA
jgi:hypothetical protein